MQHVHSGLGFEQGNCLKKQNTHAHKNHLRNTWADLNTPGYLFEQTPGDSEGQGSQARCCPWGRRVGHN